MLINFGLTYLYSLVNFFTNFFSFINTEYYSLLNNLLNDFIAQLSYNPKAPLLFNSGFFLVFFFVFILINTPLQTNKVLRNSWIVVASVYFYYKSSGYFFILMLATTVFVFALALSMGRIESKTSRKLLSAFGIIVLLLLLSYYKYFNFLIESINSIFESGITTQTIFLPLGISFYTFELISYLADVYTKKAEPEKNLLDFCFYVSFFPHLVAGPIVRPNELFPQIKNLHIPSKTEIGSGVFLLISGIIKKAIISDYISMNFVDRIFDNPTLYSGVENLLGVYGYTLQIYCDFSGYTDMALGIALLIGFKLPNNFNVPYISTSITEFWRRWHISLSSWLRDYLYIPLGGNRKGKLRKYFNLFITMLLGGLWHGASWKFMFWGALHGLALAFEKLVEPITKKHASTLFKILGGIITFHFVAFCWIFFRASTFEIAWSLINQVFSNFSGYLFFNIITSYKLVFIFIVVGYFIHFIPKKYDTKLEGYISKMPLFLQVVMLFMVLMIFIQVKSSAIQPFIYFQF
jgi:alginate O-acetyltransferase complex protein AlgI